MNEDKYILPVAVHIESKANDKMVRRIGEAIHDAIEELLEEPEFDREVKYIKVEYSIHKKMRDEDFEEDDV